MTTTWDCTGYICGQHTNVWTPWCSTHYPSPPSTLAACIDYVDNLRTSYLDSWCGAGPNACDADDEGDNNDNGGDEGDNNDNGGDENDNADNGGDENDNADNGGGEGDNNEPDGEEGDNADNGGDEGDNPQPDGEEGDNPEPDGEEGDNPEPDNEEGDNGANTQNGEFITEDGYTCYNFASDTAEADAFNQAHIDKHNEYRANHGPNGAGDLAYSAELTH